MDARLDTSFESWGGFSEKTQDSRIITGRLHYDPNEGIELDLAENPRGIEQLIAEAAPEPDTIYGQLVDGTHVTLSGCFARESSFGAGIGSPTTLVVNRALFGRHVADLDQLSVKTYSTELSSLANWMCLAWPVKYEVHDPDGKFSGLDANYRPPGPIHIELPRANFDLTISHSMTARSNDCAFTIEWRAYIKVAPRERMLLRDANQVAWQCQNLMSLLIGHQLGVRSIAIIPADSSQDDAANPALHLLFHQRGKHDHRDAHAGKMLLPYALVKDEFPHIVETWFSRSEQAVLACNVFFGSQYAESPTVDVKFLSLVQAAESYHRSLGTGLYMQDQDYGAAIEELLRHMPVVIQGDHRQSLKSRLRYGNEHSLRKRLTDLLDRIPENARLRIAGDVTQFVAKVVDTRNYHTHYDHAAKANAFEGISIHVAAERVRILVVANLLHDLGIKNEKLLETLERDPGFRHWMRQELPLSPQ
jgi:hypothetical protein